MSVPFGKADAVDPAQLEALSVELAKHIKSEQDIAALSRQLLKLTVERALQVEMEDHLGYAKHAQEGHGSGNSRNGYSSKTLKGDMGEVEIQTPRDRQGRFEPQLIGKGQTRLTAFDDQLLTWSAKGMTTRDIAETFRERYGADVSASLISKVTDAVWETVQAWQTRPGDALYPILYLDGIVVKIRQDNRVINKTVYVALGINLDGHKAVLGLWLAETDGAKRWLAVLTERQNRGLKDVVIACVDGLTGFPEAIQTVYPNAKIPLGIVHLMRHALNDVAYQDRRAVAAELKRIYQAVTVAEAERALEQFSERWDGK